MRLVTEDEEAEAVWDLVRVEDWDPGEDEEDDEEEDMSLRAVIIVVVIAIIFTLLGVHFESFLDTLLLVCRWHRVIDAAILFINSIVMIALPPPKSS